MDEQMLVVFAEPLAQFPLDGYPGPVVVCPTFFQMQKSWGFTALRASENK